MRSATPRTTKSAAAVKISLEREDAIIRKAGRTTKRPATRSPPIAATGTSTLSQRRAEIPGEPEAKKGMKARAGIAAKS